MICDTLSQRNLKYNTKIKSIRFQPINLLGILHNYLNRNRIGHGVYRYKNDVVRYFGSRRVVTLDWVFRYVFKKVVKYKRKKAINKQHTEGFDKIVFV
jgi:hypothetical protein